MLEIAKLAVFCAVVWTMWLAIPIAAALVGTVLALWVLYFFSKVTTEEFDDAGPAQTDRSPDENR